MNKKTGIIIGIIAVFLVVIAGIFLTSTLMGADSQPSPSEPTFASQIPQLDDVTAIAANIDYSKYDLNTILNNNPLAGNLPENIEGSSSAPVVIYEYADYQCSYCALMNTYINQIVKDYKGKVAVVLRTYVLPYHSNGIAAAAAANAAARQGYWAEYKDLLFENQDDWFSSDEETLQRQLNSYFLTASNNKGDLDQFYADMISEDVTQKIAFDLGAGSKMEIGGTPWFFLDGKWIENSNLSPAEYAQKIRSTIDAKLKTQK